MFAILAVLDFAIAFVLNATNANVPSVVDNWGMLFIGLVLLCLHIVTGWSVGAVVRRRP